MTVQHSHGRTVSQAHLKKFKVVQDDRNDEIDHDHAHHANERDKVSRDDGIRGATLALRLDTARLGKVCAHFFGEGCPAIVRGHAHQCQHGRWKGVKVGVIVELISADPDLFSLQTYAQLAVSLEAFG